ncbi:cytochrome c oxidase subunit II [Natrialbaceae archaeon A-arb3/5]
MQVQTRVDVFEEIFLVFLALGTLVGVVVVAYTLYNAYKYRDSGRTSDDENAPTLGELPTGGKGGKKLFLSFGLSAIIVISLVIWTYGMLLYVEDGPDENPEDALEVDVEGNSFTWFYEYDNGIETSGELVVPTDEPVWLSVTGGDVWHSYGISDLRVKADAIPGEVDETWFMAEETGEYTAECFELCGFGHSGMTSEVTVLEPDEYEQWVDEQLTMTITLEDADEEPVTDGFEVAVEHQENAEFDADLSATLGPEDFENGTVELGDFEQGGTYDVTITPTDDEFEEIEDTIDLTGPTSETYELVDPDADDEDDEDETDDESDDDEESADDEADEGGDDE